MLHHDNKGDGDGDGDDDDDDDDATMQPATSVQKCLENSQIPRNDHSLSEVSWQSHCCTLMAVWTPACS